MNNKNDYQGGDPGSMQMSSVHQSLDPNTTQSDDLYQSLNPKIMQQDDIYLSLNPNTTQLRAADQSLNPNTTQPEDIYQNLVSQHHSTTDNWHFTLSLELFSLIPNGWWNLIVLFCQFLMFNYILDYLQSFYIEFCLILLKCLIWSLSGVSTVQNFFQIKTFPWPKHEQSLENNGAKPLAIKCTIYYKKPRAARCHSGQTPK